MAQQQQLLTFEQDSQMFVFNCPHCLGTITVHVSEVNCRIFRHAVYKSTGEPVNPHASQQELNMLLQTNQVYGCAKPFRIVQVGGVGHAESCDYI